MLRQVPCAPDMAACSMLKLLLPSKSHPLLPHGPHDSLSMQVWSVGESHVSTVQIMR